MTVTNRAIGLGAVRLDLMDSLSSLGPEAMTVFLRQLRARWSARSSARSCTSASGA
ncbi:hypothetical protein [Actinosynnema sp. ALI-1.44]|uniref:hypothetical protein n=1 Tax=Actinosynnema sp. ALI-1.44 TaxID=1933779 RepID=UPI00143D4F18|nr:hypothetical protein [Actinosynnema sp. ALI-1.44]